MFHNEGIVFMLQIYCSQYYHYYFYRVIFPSRSYFFWLEIPAWLLWTMSFWLLVDLSVIPGRQRCLNCCMPLERALLMGLLEFQSVSTVLFVSNIPAFSTRAAVMMQQAAMMLVTPLRRLWPERMNLFHASFSLLDAKLASSRDDGLCWYLLFRFLFFGCHLNNKFDEIW